MKKLIFSVLAVAAMASCSKSELVERPVDAAIAVKSEVLTVKQSTKAPFEGITATESLVARVLASTTSANYEPTLYHDDSMTFGPTAATTAVPFTNSKAYPTDGSSVFLCGLYPNDTNWTNFAYSSGGGTPRTNFNYVIDGKTDVMIAPQVETKKAEALVNNFKTLAFDHKLTYLVIRAKANSTSAIDDFGAITDITLTKANGSNPKTTLLARVEATTVSTSFPGVESDGTEVTSFPFYTIGTDGAATDTAFTGQNVALVEVDNTTVTVAPSIAYSLVAPVTADGTEDYELLVKTEKNTAGFPVKVNLRDAAGSAFNGTTRGYKFVITLDFESTPIQALGTVTEWTEVVMPDDITIK